MRTSIRNPQHRYDILLADDDPDEHDFFKSAVERMAYNRTFKSFLSGEDLIQFLQKLTSPQYPLLIVLDMHMSLMSGKDVLRYLKSTYRFSSIPVIVNSSEMHSALRAELLSMGAVTGIQKCVGVRELQQVLVSALLPDFATSAK